MAALLLAVLGSVTPVHAAGLVSVAPSDDFDRDVFFFGGRFHDGYFWQSITPWTANFENNYIVGGGYQQFFGRWGILHFGAEVGVADRFTTNSSTPYPGNSGEVWAGGVARIEGLHVGPVEITPALTAGFSVVSGLIGVEYDRVQALGGAPDRSFGGHFLYYLGPELAFSLASAPGVEVFTRAQHRSGGFGTIAPVDGSNANVVGLRFKF